MAYKTAIMRVCGARSSKMFRPAPARKIILWPARQTRRRRPTLRNLSGGATPIPEITSDGRLLGGSRQRVGRPTRPMSTDSLPIEPRRRPPALSDASGDRFKKLMKRAEDAVEDFRAHALSFLFGLFATIVVVAFIGAVIASLTLRRDKRPGRHHAAT